MERTLAGGSPQQSQATADTDSQSGATAANARAADRVVAELTHAREYVVKTAHTALNLRSTPAFGDNIIGHLPRGSTVQGSERSGDFVAVRSNGQQGWAHVHYLVTLGGEAVATTHAGPSAEGSRATNHEAATSHASEMKSAAAATEQATSHSQVVATASPSKAVEHAASEVLGQPPPIVEPKSDYPLEEIHGQLYVQEGGDKNAIDPNDVSQGLLGDCWFLSGIAAVARANPDALKRLIKDNGNGTYDITLYLADHVWSAKTPHVMRVDSKFPVDKDTGEPAYDRPRNGGEGGSELWVMLLEKAYAQHQGSYETKFKFFGGMEGGTEGSGIEIFTAGSSTTHQTALNSQPQMMSDITQALGEHRPVTAGTSPILLPSSKARARELGLVDGHEYSVKSTNPKAMTISLQNPWGFQHLDNLSMEDFNKFYLSYAIGPKV